MSSNYEEDLTFMHGASPEVASLIKKCSHHIRFLYQQHLKNHRKVINKVFVHHDVQEYLGYYRNCKDIKDIDRELAKLKSIKGWRESYPLLALILTTSVSTNKATVQLYEQNMFLIALLVPGSFRRSSQQKKTLQSFNKRMTEALNYFRNSLSSDEEEAFAMQANFMDEIRKNSQDLEEYFKKALKQNFEITGRAKLSRQTYFAGHLYSQRELDLTKVPFKRQKLITDLISECLYNNHSQNLLGQPRQVEHFEEKAADHSEEDSVDITDQVIEKIQPLEFEDDSHKDKSDSEDDANPAQEIKTVTKLDGKHKKSDFMQARVQANAISNRASKNNIYAAWHPGYQDEFLVGLYVSRILLSIVESPTTLSNVVLFLALVLGRPIESVCQLIKEKKVSNNPVKEPDLEYGYRYSLDLELDFPMHKLKDEEKKCYDNYKVFPSGDTLFISLLHNYIFPDLTIKGEQLSDFIQSVNQEFKKMVQIPYRKIPMVHNIATQNLFRMNYSSTTAKYLAAMDMTHQPDMTYLQVTNYQIYSLINVNVSQLNKSLRYVPGQKTKIKVHAKNTFKRREAVGSKLQLRKSKFRNILYITTKNLERLNEPYPIPSLIDQHNAAVSYVFLLFLICTGARPSCWKLKWSEICLISKTVVIDDKHVRKGSSERVLCLPELLASAINDYKNRLIKIGNLFEKSIKTTSQNAKKLKSIIILAEDQPFFFRLDDKLNCTELTADEILSGINKYLGKRKNLGRHYLKTYLTAHSAVQHVINSWFGHEVFGLEAMSCQSDASFSEFYVVAEEINSHCNDIINHYVENMEDDVDDIGTE